MTNEAETYYYCNSLTSYSRWKTRVVNIGEVSLGGESPIRIQSMTTTDTMDTMGTVEQSIRMIEAGCEYVRITAPSIKEAENLKNIKNELRKRGYKTPLIADIHFTPNAAEVAARLVEKVRVNPGNYADKKKFINHEYSTLQYSEELDRIRSRFLPLIKVCKEYGTVMRVGTNHGSLSDRIMSRYGDTPEGMVESALEFVRICEEESFYDVVLSMKASNPLVMIHAYRMLVSQMKKENMNYPLHLGVTEAGEGEDGRIKSAVGIGTLLDDGLGDTIRVSLTEEPEFEIPVAQAILKRYEKVLDHPEIPEIYKSPVDPFQFQKRETEKSNNIGDKQAPVVIGVLDKKEKISPASLFGFGYGYNVKDDKWQIRDQACDYLYVGKNEVDFPLPGTLGIIRDFDSKYKGEDIQLCTSNKLSLLSGFSSNNLMLSMNIGDLMNELVISWVINHPSVPLILETSNPFGMCEQRRMLFELMDLKTKNPVIIKRDYEGSGKLDTQINASVDLGGLLVEGLVDGICVNGDYGTSSFLTSTAFGILQATRSRISKTEYISCPSCGRTLFDLQETTAKIRKRTDHLKGLKIAVMGCIVNGPGEMADADYGYVGTGPGKITLYKEKEVVRRNILSEHAVDELIELIKENGDWVEL